MKSIEPNCPGCRTPMDEGFMLDRGHGNAPSPAQWAEGAPERSWWQGLKLKGKDRIAVTTYRCPRCGLLQSYARPG
jgi:hypothetical protein